MRETKLIVKSFSSSEDNIFYPPEGWEIIDQSIAVTNLYTVVSYIIAKGSIPKKRSANEVTTILTEDKMLSESGLKRSSSFSE